MRKCAVLKRLTSDVHVGFLHSDNVRVAHALNAPEGGFVVIRAVKSHVLETSQSE